MTSPDEAAVAEWWRQATKEQRESLLRRLNGNRQVGCWWSINTRLDGDPAGRAKAAGSDQREE